MSLKHSSRDSIVYVAVTTLILSTGGKELSTAGMGGLPCVCTAMVGRSFVFLR